MSQSTERTKETAAASCTGYSFRDATDGKDEDNLQGEHRDLLADAAPEVAPAGCHVNQGIAQGPGEEEQEPEDETSCRRPGES